MCINEIKINGVYKSTFKVQFRLPEEIRNVELMFRIISKNNTIQIVFLNDPTCSTFYLDPSEINPI